MQLKKIKLAGFKSFVDPTVVSLPSQLVAVVGPNGCGKSNIIDAVCWVMGESSAKYLRGESLTDVIFNGSTARKPVGQASVELVFDNQDGAIGGEYASYAEISIRRLITRDSESQYFLNGTRCRRRDIIDIFLGTGLGPRSYSIIGQNMISRLIEAKPDDMRVYLEEAAGISKYKERRRETENRIQHTKENLARLNDIRSELEKQLNTLQRQANAAEKYKLLKQEERIKKAEWHAIQWREFDTRIVDFTLQIKNQETGLEAKHSELVSTDQLLEKAREDQRTTSDQFQDVQRRFYTKGNEITRVEQEIHHHKEREKQWQHDVEQAENDLRAALGQFEEIEEEGKELSNELLTIEPELESAISTAETASIALADAETAMQNWQSQWDDFNQTTSKLTQTAQVEQTRIQHLEQKNSSLKQRQSKLKEDQAQINFDLLDSEITNLSDGLNQANARYENSNLEITQLRSNISELKNDYQQKTSNLDQLKNKLQQLRGQEASLQALQKTALGQNDNKVKQWLAEHALDQNTRLAETIQVEKGWEKAVERVLAGYLQSVCVEDFTPHLSALQKLKEGNLCIYATKQSYSSSATKPNSLLTKVQTHHHLAGLLGNIFIAENESEALTLLNSLSEQESIITKDGVWLSKSWVSVSQVSNPEAGVFERAQEIKNIANEISDHVHKITTLEEEIANIRNQLKEFENKLDDVQKQTNQIHIELANLRAQHKTKQDKKTELVKKEEQFKKEEQDLLNQTTQTENELASSRSKWQDALTQLENLAHKRDELTHQRETFREELQQKRQEANQAKELAHQLEIRVQTTRSQYAGLKQNLARMQEQIALLTQRKNQLLGEARATTTIATLEETLANALTERLEIETELNKARDSLQAHEQELRLLETKRQEIEHEISRYRDLLENLRLEWRELKVKADNVQQQVSESGHQLETILQQLPEDAIAETWQATVEQIAQRISRLGAINLVAIEEFAACSERKQYLDKQNEDLLAGLATLENAIDKIDKETRARFKETFDKVNDRFQELFPKIFGGGRAYLELTGENLLDSGITVMACPPGKRNSTIHLLSGGEKAMTAIALVFSIFHLNPAPFCLLDEVDAPLDDANIGRFCQLVKTMAEKTQFIFISHNKLAIEMAEHLMGVTMHEPGVSRLVSVDIKEAISLAGA